MVPGDVPPTRKASFRRAPALARRHRIETKLATEAARFTDRRFGAPPPRPAMEMLASYRAPFASLPLKHRRGVCLCLRLDWTSSEPTSFCRPLA